MIASSKKKKSKKCSTLWKDDHYVTAYSLARQGFTDTKIAKTLGITHSTFSSWCSKRPALKRALKKARTEKAKNFQASFRHYVYKRLSPELQEVWDEINECENEDAGVARIEAILSNQGKRVRQHLFLYALVASNFNQSEACRKVNISREALNLWVKTDPGFAGIMDEMNWHKGNFFEGGLLSLVEEGDSKATIFANRTFNRDRGYNEKIEVQHSGHVDHSVAVISIDQLNLDLDVKKAILHAIRSQRSDGLLPGDSFVKGPGVIDAEFVEAEEEVF